MTTDDLYRYLKGKYPKDKIYKGRLYGNDERCIVIYNRESAKPDIAVGGMPNTSTGVKPFRILVHWSDTYGECESKAADVYASLAELAEETAGNASVCFAQMLDGEAVDLGADEKGIFERAIRLNIFYERQ